MWTTDSELYWFEVEVILEKNRDVFRDAFIDDNWRTQYSEPSETSKGSFAKRLYLTIDYFCRTLQIICFTGLWICLDKAKQNPGVLSCISQEIKTAISANLFLN